MTRSGQQSAIMNAAEETAFEAFVEDKIGFLEMADVAEAVMEEMTGWGLPRRSRMCLRVMRRQGGGPGSV